MTAGNKGFTVPERFEVHEITVENDAEVMYRALDKTLHREVILKRPGTVLAQTLAETGDTDRALREARALAPLRHDGIVRLLEVIECEGGPLLVMDPIPGVTLAEKLEHEKRLPVPEVITIGMELADALHTLHAAGAVHRGLSTANIILKPDGKPCLAGFLFAKSCKSSIGISSISYSAAGEDDPEEAPKVLPTHPAPEQLYGQAADARSDLFGLGCVLYRCLTGQEAFEGMLSSGWTPPQDPSKLAPGISQVLSAIILKCLARSPLARYQSGAELKAELDEASRVKEKPAILKLPVMLGSLAAVAVVTTVAVMMMGGQGDTPQMRGSAMMSADDDLGGRADRYRGETGDYLADYGESHALLIGIGDHYSEIGFNRLPNAERDVEAIAKKLEEMTWEGWKVKPLLGPAATRDNIRKELARLERVAGKEDRVFVFFAGHGEQYEKNETSAWIIPADAKPVTEDQDRLTWLDFTRFTEFFNRCSAKHILVAMDCCYGGRIVSSRAASARQYEDRYLTNPAHVVIASTRPNEEASDGVRGEGSPFAQAFLQAFTLNQPAVTSSEILSEVRRTFLDEDVPHDPTLGYPGNRRSGEFVFFLEDPSDG